MGKSYTKEQQAAYMKQYRAARRQEAVDRLGGKCARCESVDQLQLDHIERDSKKASIASFWGTKEEFNAEVAKCQLLCAVCHRRKTLEEVGLDPDNLIHGTNRALRYCKPRCDECSKMARSNYVKWRDKRKMLG